MVMAAIISFIGGVFLVTGRTLNGQLGQRAGVKFATLMNYLSGLAGTLVIVLMTGSFPASFPQADLPVVYYMGGMIGVGAVLLGTWATSRAPSMQMTLIMFISQLFMSMMLDAFLLDKFSPGQLVGGVIVLLGVVLTVKGDKQKT